MSTKGDVEYDVHGLVGIRLIGASASDVATVDRQLGNLRQHRLGQFPPEG